MGFPSGSWILAKTTVGMVLRIDVYFDASGAELCGHLVQVSRAKVDHPNLAL
jgi:hypothetical protein